VATAYQALHDAGFNRDSLQGSSTGVYVGMMSNDVTTDFKEVCEKRESRWPLAFSLSGIETAVAAGRVSYCFGLHGPAVCVNTACSSSLVALDGQQLSSILRGFLSGSVSVLRNVQSAPDFCVLMGKFRR
jgi:acyl transferase domain-containing protein